MNGWRPAPVDVEVVDVWPPGTLDAASRYAYDVLHGRGRIRLQSAHTDPRSGRKIVKYMADIPAPWIREELGRIKRTYDGTQMTISEE